MEQALAFLYGALFESPVGLFITTLWAIVIIEVLYYFVAVCCSLFPIIFHKKKEFSRMQLRYEGRRNGAAGVSILLAGHNDVEGLRETIDSLNEQTLQHLEIVVVNDGSTDNTDSFCRELLKKQKIHKYLCLKARGGKVAAINAAATISHYPYLVICDAGTTFNNDAIEIGMAYFSNPKVAGVGMNLIVKNYNKNLLTITQAFEYLFSILLSRGIFRMMGFSFNISGAAGIFRRDMFERVGGYSANSGEDLELAMILRYLGWKIEFSVFSIALTDVPENLGSFIRQRLRWDKDAARIMLKKYTKLSLNPGIKHFDLWMSLGILEFFIIRNILSIMVYIYIAYHFYLIGDTTLYILLAVYIVYVAIMLVYGAFAMMMVDRFYRRWHLLLYTPFHVLYKELLLRPLWLYSMFLEMILNLSNNEAYLPSKVRKSRKGHKGEKLP